jgi:hypothetical protein
MQNNFLSGSFEMFVVTFYSLQQHIKRIVYCNIISSIHTWYQRNSFFLVKSFLVGWVLFRFSTKFSLYCSPCLSHVFTSKLQKEKVSSEFNQLFRFVFHYNWVVLPGLGLSIPVLVWKNYRLYLYKLGSTSYKLVHWLHLPSHQGSGPS